MLVIKLACKPLLRFPKADTAAVDSLKVWVSICNTQALIPLLHKVT